MGWLPDDEDTLLAHASVHRSCSIIGRISVACIMRSFFESRGDTISLQYRDTLVRLSDEYTFVQIYMK
jgi:hypothetical protein